MISHAGAIDLRVRLLLPLPFPTQQSRPLPTWPTSSPSVGGTWAFLVLLLECATSPGHVAWPAARLVGFPCLPSAVRPTPSCFLPAGPLNVGTRSTLLLAPASSQTAASWARMASVKALASIRTCQILPRAVIIPTHWMVPFGYLQREACRSRMECPGLSPAPEKLRCVATSCN